VKTALCLIALGALNLLAQEKGGAWVGVPLGNGMVLRLSTQANGPNGQTVAIQGTLLRSGSAAFHRVLMDSSSRPVFAYDLELPDATSAPSPVRLQIKPVDAAYARTLAWPMPTFSSVRTVTLNAPGERASIELLVNPKTGQKIFDVLEIVGAPDTAGGAAAGVAGNAPGNELRFSHAELWSNGVNLTPQSANAIRGNVIMLYIPGRGGFFFSRIELKGYGFQKAGSIDGATLKFTWANQAYECISAAPILPDDGDKQIWVFHDPQYKPRNPPGLNRGDRFQFGAADSAQRLLGDR
jgi:hypothetical protein